ncbi:MAG: hypothetical protein DI628_05905 [Blastochloris viridis]|uniref:Uncharacterized protein n=1 Tax=Blastochloris viridis TaxID=1079 RepID=A0A6N4RAZ9_BLAVI|nr:MAG: hypothetical protein DI628_05905 [Blastochloris viridis]
MIKRLALLSCLLPAIAFADYKVAFGEADLTPEVPQHVTGPLVQLQSAGGTTLSFQQGSRFVIGKGNRITLLSGNMRVGPAGGDMLLLTLPQGPATVAPLTALTITASAAQASGKVYQGQITVSDKTFNTGQGFVLTRNGAESTFSPAPAEAPQPTTVTTPQNQMPQPQTPAEEQPPAPQPETEQPPQSQEPDVVTPQEPTPEQPTIPTTPQPEPEPQPEPQPEPEVQTEPQPEPQTPSAPELLDSNVTLNSAVIGFSRNMSEGLTANATQTKLLLDSFSDNTFAPNTVITNRFATSTRLMRGTSQLAEWASNGNVAGIARWVGGSQMVVKGSAVTELANSHSTETENGPLTTPHSLHMVWGQTGVAPTLNGTLNYTLAAATQPTYTDGTASDGAHFTGNLSITFDKGYSGAIGHYSFNGEVTMPASSPEANATTYTLTTANTPVPFNAAAFTSPGDLHVTSTPNATACPTGSCTGTVNIAGFGNGMGTAGALYTINPTGPVGIEGAALFTATPQ